MKHVDVDVLGDDEVAAHILQLLTTNPKGVNEVDILTYVRWIEELTLKAALLELVKEGRAKVHFENGEIVLTHQPV